MRAAPSSAGTVCALVPRESELEGSRFTELRKFALGWKINRAAGTSASGREQTNPGRAVAEAIGDSGGQPKD